MEPKQLPKPQPTEEEQGILAGIPEVLMIEDHLTGIGIKIGSNTIGADKLAGIALGLRNGWRDQGGDNVPKKTNGGYVG